MGGNEIFFVNVWDVRMSLRPWCLLEWRSFVEFVLLIGLQVLEV